MLHINKFKFGLKENTFEICKDHHTHFPNSLSSVTSGKKSKKSVKILATIGPKSCSENSIKKISKYTNLFRINGSHNTGDMQNHPLVKIQDAYQKSIKDSMNLYGICIQMIHINLKESN